MGLIATLANRADMPVCPVDVADEVELYARETNRHATCKFVPTKMGAKGRILEGTWRVDMTLHPEDKRNVTFQEGRMAERPVEEIWLHVENPESTGWQDRYIPLNIHELGASGVRQFLEKGNVHSGRGEFASLEDAIRRADEINEAKQQKQEQEAEDRVRRRARDRRRSRL